MTYNAEQLLRNKKSAEQRAVFLKPKKLYTLYKDGQPVGIGTQEELTMSIVLREKTNYDTVRVVLYAIIAGKRKSYRGYTMREQFINEGTKQVFIKLLSPYCNKIAPQKAESFKKLESVTSMLLNVMSDFCRFMNNGEQPVVTNIYEHFTSLYDENDNVDVTVLERLSELCVSYGITRKNRFARDCDTAEETEVPIFDMDEIRPALTNPFFASAVYQQKLSEEEEREYVQWCHSAASLLMQQMSVTE